MNAPALRGEMIAPDQNEARNHAPEREPWDSVDDAAATRLPVKTETSLEEEIQKNALSQQDSNQTLPAVNQPGDIRNGKAYAAMHRGKLLFVKPMARWFRWDETRWAICRCGDEMEAAKETANLLLHEAPKVAAADPDKGKRLFTYALQTQNLPRLEAMIRLASSEPCMVIGEAGRLDADVRFE